MRHAEVLEPGLDEGQALDELAEHEDRLALGGDDVDQLLQRRQLARTAGQRARLVQVLRRVVADLLQHGEEAEHETLPGDAVLVLDRLQGLAHLGLVEGGLLLGERDRHVGDGPRRQVGGDARIGLLPAEEERADRTGEPLGGQRVPVALDGSGHRAHEPFERAEQSGGGPVEDRPQLAQPVLDRGPGEGQAGGAADGAQGPRRRRLRVLRVLGLVGDHQAEAGRRQRLGVPAGDAVARDDDLVRGQVLEAAGGTVVTADHAPGSEPPHLALPVAEQRRRADHERRSSVGGGPVEVEGDHLQRLPETHVVGQAAAEPGVDHGVQPRDATGLVRAELDVGRQTEGDAELALRRAGDGGQAAGQLRQRPVGDHGNGLSVEVDACPPEACREPRPPSAVGDDGPSGARAARGRRRPSGRAGGRAPASPRPAGRSPPRRAARRGASPASGTRRACRDRNRLPRRHRGQSRPTRAARGRRPGSRPATAPRLPCPGGGWPRRPAARRGGRRRDRGRWAPAGGAAARAGPRRGPPGAGPAAGRSRRRRRTGPRPPPGSDRDRPRRRPGSTRRGW